MRIVLTCLLLIATSAFGGVAVSSPTHNSGTAPVHFVASTTTSCAKGVSAMGIYSAPYVLAYKVAGSSLNTYLNLASGAYHTEVQERDHCGGASKTPITVKVSGGSSGVPLSRHVVVVMEENHSYSSVIGNAAMPYLNSLASKYALLTQYYANTHPSIGNYLMLTTGQIITNDDTFCGTLSQDNIVRHLLTAGKTWKSYAESLPSVGYTGCGSGSYVKRHNPLAYFSDVANSSQKYNLVQFTRFSKDLANNALPQFSFVVPNLLDDAHDGSLSQADSWLKTNIAPLIANPAFQNDGILIILFDESVDMDTAHGGGHVAAVVIGPKVKPGYKSTSLYQHQNTLKMLLQALGVTSFPGSASTATPISDVF